MTRASRASVYSLSAFRMLFSTGGSRAMGAGGDSQCRDQWPMASATASGNWPPARRNMNTAIPTVRLAGILRPFTVSAWCFFDPRFLSVLAESTVMSARSPSEK